MPSCNAAILLKASLGSQNSPIEIRLLGLTLCTEPTSSPYVNLLTANEKHAMNLCKPIYVLTYDLTYFHADISANYNS